LVLFKGDTNIKYLLATQIIHTGPEWAFERYVNQRSIHFRTRYDILGKERIVDADSSVVYTSEKAFFCNGIRR